MPRSAASVNARASKLSDDEKEEEEHDTVEASSLVVQSCAFRSVRRLKQRPQSQHFCLCSCSLSRSRFKKHLPHPAHTNHKNGVKRHTIVPILPTQPAASRLLSSTAMNAKCPLAEGRDSDAKKL